MKLTKNQINEKYTGVLTTEKVNNIIHKENQAEKLKKEEHIWFDNQAGVRKAGVRFASTQKEVNEYAKCKLDVQYFADNNCQIKLEDGSVGPMTLRDYQKDIIDLYMDNNFSILMASRQMGKCNSFCIKVLAKNSDGVEEKISIGQLYYNELQKDRKLTFTENIKLFLYRIIDNL